MPIYNYICICDKKEQKEELQKLNNEIPIYCSCQKEMIKTVANTSFQLKGPGWAKDLYHKNNES